MNKVGNIVERLFILFIFFLGPVIAEAQSKMIKKVFMLLPNAFVYELNDATKDSMLKGKTYYPSENDSESVLAYNYGYSTIVKDYMYVSMSYETEQRGSGMVEIRAFEINGKKLIIVSKTAGVEGINYQQNDISAFIFDGNNTLKPYKEKIFPNWSVNMFMKPGTPDSIKKVVMNNANLTFNFSKKNVTLSINSSYLIDKQEYRKWLKGSQVEYTWTGKKFIAGPMTFSY